MFDTGSAALTFSGCYKEVW